MAKRVQSSSSPNYEVVKSLLINSLTMKILKNEVMLTFLKQPNHVPKKTKMAEHGIGRQMILKNIDNNFTRQENNKIISLYLSEATKQPSNLPPEKSPQRIIIFTISHL